MLTAAPTLFDSFSALSDATRCRLLALIEHHELTVSELCAVLQLPQSTVSRHLKLLADAGWVSSRRDGTSRYYALALDGAGGPRSQIWDLTKPQIAARVGAGQDSGGWPAYWPAAGKRRSSSLRRPRGSGIACGEELFGADFLPGALLGLLPSTWTVGDLGCGTGALLPLLAPHVAHVVGVDASREMLATAARAREGSAERGPAARHPRVAAARGRVARRCDVRARAASPAGARETRWPRRIACSSRRAAARRRHAGARSRGLPPADGARLAGFLRRPDAQISGADGIRSRVPAFAAAFARGQRTDAVRGSRVEDTLLNVHNEQPATNN